MIPFHNFFNSYLRYDYEMYSLGKLLVNCRIISSLKVSKSIQKSMNIFNSSYECPERLHFMRKQSETVSTYPINILNCRNPFRPSWKLLDVGRHLDSLSSSYLYFCPRTQGRKPQITHYLIVKGPLQVPTGYKAHFYKWTRIEWDFRIPTHIESNSRE